MNPISEEIGETARSIVAVMKDSPLLLSLVIVNFALVAFMFYTNNQVLTQRQQALNQIVEWQKATDTLMANCVSMEVTKLTLDHMQKITETMLRAEQQEIQRMQKVIDQEREFNRSLLPNFPRPPGSPPPSPLEHLLPK